jgi:hypothetical protein
MALRMPILKAIDYGNTAILANIDLYIKTI